MRVTVLVAVAVFSHWLLDALFHVAELPVAGIDSMKVGLGLWQSMPVATCRRSPYRCGGSLPLRVRRESVAGEEIRAYSVDTSHPCLHHCRYDRCATPALGDRNGCEFAGHDHCGLRPDWLAREASHMNNAPN